MVDVVNVWWANNMDAPLSKYLSLNRCFSLTHLFCSEFYWFIHIIYVGDSLISLRKTLPIYIPLLWIHMQDSIKVNVATDQCNSQNEIWTLNNEIKLEYCTKLALSASWTHGLIAQGLNGIQWSWVQIPVSTSFYSYF